MGCLAGLAVFAVCAALWRLGDTRAAEAAAQTALLLALVSIALAGLFPRATPRMTRIRVPVSRAMPPMWGPREPDISPLIAACAGAPALAGALAAFLIFR